MAVFSKITSVVAALTVGVVAYDTAMKPKHQPRKEKKVTTVAQNVKGILKTDANKNKKTDANTKKKRVKFNLPKVDRWRIDLCKSFGDCRVNEQGLTPAMYLQDVKQWLDKRKKFFEKQTAKRWLQDYDVSHLDLMNCLKQFNGKPFFAKTTEDILLKVAQPSRKVIIKRVFSKSEDTNIQIPYYTMKVPKGTWLNIRESDIKGHVEISRARLDAQWEQVATNTLRNVDWKEGYSSGVWWRHWWVDLHKKTEPQNLKWTVSRSEAATYFCKWSPTLSLRRKKY